MHTFFNPSSLSQFNLQKQTSEQSGPS